MFFHYNLSIFNRYEFINNSFLRDLKLFVQSLKHFHDSLFENLLHKTVIDMRLVEVYY